MKIEIGFFPAIIAAAIYLGGLLTLILYVIYFFRLATVDATIVLSELERLL
ncbi:MAG: hypothetical protein ABW172_10940 [Candidatus Binatia bacterium]|jgi:hypothetical protein